MGHASTLRLSLMLCVLVSCNNCRGGVAMIASQSLTAWVAPAASLICTPVPGANDDFYRRLPNRSTLSTSSRTRTYGRAGRREVAPLSVSRKPGLDEEGFESVERIDVRADGTAESTSLALTRKQVVIGGWSACLGLLYVAGKQDQDSYHDRKGKLFRRISGEDVRDVLEVGVGGNPKVGGFSNLEYYRRGQRIVGVDPALSGEPSSSLEVASAKAQNLGLTLQGVGGTAEELPFESGSFDAVVSTLVLCSVRDPAAALREVSRVLRPGGKFLFVEHIHAPEEGLSILGLRQQQDLIDPLQQQLADGCHLTRDTDRLIRDATGGSPASRLFSRVESMENVRVKSMWPVSEQVFGVVVK